MNRCPPALRHLVPALFGVALLTSCETMDEDKYQGITVSPTYTKLWLNGSVTLTASGGFNYRWSLADSSYGSLSSSTGNSVTYTVRKLPAANTEFLQTITVSGSVANYASASGTTNNALYTAQAQVRHTPEKEDPAAVAIAGADTAIVEGATVALSASGGDGKTYTWSLSNGGIGALSGTTGSKVTYRATANDKSTQTIKVVSGGATATHTVIHQTAVTAVTITASSTQATVNGAPVTLTASGGNGVDYTWSIRSPAIGTLPGGTTGRQVTYRATAGDNSTQIVTVTSAGKSYQIVIVNVL